MTANPLPDSPARRFNGRVEREQICLPRNGLYEANDFANSRRRISQLCHCRDGALSFGNRAASYFGRLRCL